MLRKRKAQVCLQTRCLRYYNARLCATLRYGHILITSVCSTAIMLRSRLLHVICDKAAAAPLPAITRAAFYVLSGTSYARR